MISLNYSHCLLTKTEFFRLKRYKTYARNVLSLADLSRSELNLKQGGAAIIDLLNLLPASEHDPYSFTVDLIYCTVSFF